MGLKSIVGVVSSKIGRHLTIKRFDCGNDIEIKVKRTDLELGDKCAFSFNYETGEIAEIVKYSKIELDIDIDAIEPTPLPKLPAYEETPYDLGVFSITED